jgi:hypothetical protein
MSFKEVDMYEVVSHIACILRSLDCEYTIKYRDRHYSSQKPEQSGPKFRWEEDLFELMKTAEPGDQVDFTIDKEWDSRKIQSFRTAVRNHAIKFWGENNFTTTYDKETGVVSAIRSETCN